MATANWLDVSYYQDPSMFDYKAAKDAGIVGLIIRSGYGKTQDTAAASHIANCKKFGLKWHLYHYWYNMSGEAEFAVQNAKSLGLSANQYLFLDMEDKSLPADWNGQFAMFRNAVGNTFKAGLYCSDSPYKAKFQDSQLQQLKVYRWIASYSYEPANYDCWQMSSKGGYGSYTGNIDHDYDKTGGLSTYSDTPSPTTPSAGDDDKPTPIEPPELTPDMPNYRAIVEQPGFDTESGIWGYGYSPDNGEHFYVLETVWGRKYRQEDADRLWQYLQGFVSKQIASAVSLTWDNIKGKPDVALKSDLPVVPTDLVHTAELEKVKSDVTQAKQDAAQAVANTESAKVTIDTSNIHQIKKPSEYSEGFSYELKEVSELIPDRSNLDSTAQDGSQGIVTTEACKGYARQTLKVIDSRRPLTFIRNGSGDSWYPFELVTTW